MLRAKYNLNGHLSLKGATKMRVFCPEHKRGFFAPRQSPVKCENRGHLLGEIDFEGQALHPVDLQWQFCCNCEHFCPVDFDQYGLQRCPVCTRKSSQLYLCDRCYVISFESNTPLQTKNFTLTADGAPQPSCPGCLRQPVVDLHEHSCEVVNATFVTGLDTCPICSDRLDITPAFPSTVADYLKATKAANKVLVTFDYETGAFAPVEDGEFVLVTGLDQPIVLPRATKFSARRDFYEYYQDYYHCANPDAGEVQVIQPAFVSRAPNGWALTATGLLEVVKPQSKQGPAAPTARPPAKPPIVARREEPARPVAAPVAAPPAPQPQPEEKEESGARACSECGSMIEAKYSFCWKCGNPMSNDRTSSIANGHNPPSRMSSEPFDADDELTVQHEHDTPVPSSKNFSWTTGRKGRSGPSRGSVLKLLVIGAIGSVIVSLGLIGLLRSDTATAEATSAPQPAAQQPSQPQSNTAQITTEVSRTAPAETTTTQQVAPSTPEDELKKLRDKRITAKPADKTRIFQAFAKVEKQYPRDYRFPYERAKLVVKVSESNPKDEAFKALNTAAEKAISAGKANEMLTGLESDKSGDFSKLAQGRFEWGRLVAALKRKDPNLLSE